MTSCDIPTVDLLEDFEAPTFENTRAIRWMHAATPRFGHSNDLTLLDGSQDDQSDYIMGLIASSIAMFCFFLVWMSFLLVFRFMGPSEVGFLSGQPKTLPARPQQEAELEDWQILYQKAERRLTIYRMIVVLCGFAIVLSSILMSIHGVDSLTQSLTEGRDSISIAQTLARDAIELIDTVTEQTTETSTVVDELMEDVNSICPAVRDPICADITDSSTCNFEGVFDETFSTILGNTVEYFQNPEQSVYYHEIVNARDDLEDLLKASKDVDDSAATFHWALYCAMTFSWLLAILCICIVVGLACRVSTFLTCLRHYVLVPAFSTLVSLSFVCSVLFIMGSMAVADLCIDSPDEQILVILNRFQDSLSPLVVSFASFYIQECPPNLIPQELSTQLEYVVQAIPTLGDFSSIVQDSSEAIQDVCGFDDPSRLVNLAETANGQLCQVAQVLDSIRVYFQCSNWFPLYSNTMYQAVCYNGTDGFSWVASTQFVIVFCSVLLLTFRAAFQEVIVEGQDLESKSAAGTAEETSYGGLGKRNSDPPFRQPPKVITSSSGEEFELSYDDDSSSKHSC